jgi:ABC-2 type transport system permease protein
MSTVLNEVTSSPARMWLWSIRRELWENRSIYVAPLIAAGVALFGFLGNAAVGGTAKAQRGSAVLSFSTSASMIMLTGFIAGAFYCLDALNGERRDRSILFWKSLPVSDRMTVLSKASIPSVVQPLITFSIVLGTQLLMLALSAPMFVLRDVSPSEAWAPVSFIPMWLGMLYGLTIHAIWFAPLYAWFLLVSAWAKRAAILWALLPFVAVYALERLTLGTKLFGTLLHYRFFGAMAEGFTVDPGKTAITRLAHLDPLRFLTSTGLWTGLILAAVFLALAVRLRRNREPM